MKRILITGANSYIGTSFEKWMKQFDDSYQIDTLDMQGNAWKEHDFGKYDSIFHVAGIAHIKETKNNQANYYKVNRDLAYETAKKAKKDGVNQFVFLSSMSVYGIDTGIIKTDSPLNPNSAYGKSKIEAEKLIDSLQDTSFIVAIVRPPMVYGKGCKGNYPRLVKLALKSPIFLEVENKRSMIYIDNLSEFVKKLIDNRSGGTYFPQNTEYVNTSQMVRMIAEVHGKKIKMTKLFNPLLRVFRRGTVNKVFGDLVYERSMSKYKDNYRIFGFEESIKNTEQRK